MQWVYTPYMLPLLLSAAVSGLLGIYLAGRRAAPGIRPFAVILLAGTTWSIFYILEIGSLTLEQKVFWAGIEYFGIAIIPVAWLTFSIQYSGHGGWLKPYKTLLFASIPLATVILFWTNAVHHLVWSEAGLDTSGPFPSLAITYGIWFWVFLVYTYTLLAAGAFLLLQSLKHTAQWYSRQVVPLIIGISIPWVGNLLYVFKVPPFPYLDLTPVAFSLSGLILLWGVFRFWLFDLVPVARAAVVESMGDGVLVIDEQDRLVDINPSAAHLLGVEASAIIRQKADTALARFPNLLGNHLAGNDIHVDFTVNEGEETRYFDVRISPIKDNYRHLKGRSLIFHEITEKRLAEQELERSHSILLATFDATADGIMVTNGRGKSVRFNRKFIDMWNMSPEIANSPEEQDRMAYILDQLSNPAAFYRLMNKLSVQPDADSYDVLELKDGRIFERYSRPQKIGDKRVGRVWSFHDITEQHRAEERLRFLSTHDILTGLYNRVYFEEEINRLEGSRQYPISLIVADMDGLKENNDRYGHQAGDAMLRRAAEVLRQACRSEDMVARIGGDEFGIVLPKSSANVAEAAVERIKQGMSHFHFGEIDIPISLSLGAATAQSGESLRTVFRQADKVMYQAKRAKRQRRTPGPVAEHD